jgi:predicted transglutaminase-like cysteine proteinase
MSAIARARGAARWLPVLLSLGFITAAAAVDADRIPQGKGFARADEPFVIAMAEPAASDSNPVARAPAAIPPVSMPLMSPMPAPAPARFFTINEVLAKRNARPQSDSSVRLASADPGHITTDAKGDEPFGLFTFVAPDGLLWTKWRKVVDEIRAEEAALMRCVTDSTQCSLAAARFGAIINDAREQNGRARLDLVNRRVNTAIRYKNDVAQWGMPDLWSSPLNANNSGSFSSGFGDCEDFAIAKYVALRAAGVPARHLRVLLVHDKMARMDHAVLAALDEGHWLILDNRWMTLVEDTEAKQFVPLFALDEQGVKLLAVPYAAQRTPTGKVAETGDQIFVPGGATEPAPTSSGSVGMTDIGSAPMLL